MRALVFTAIGVVETMDVPEPVVHPGEVLLHVERTGICGSELHGIQHASFRVPPLIMGHEMVGRTEDGQFVAVNPLASCGHCEQCRTNHPQICRSRSLLGAHQAGGFAERVAVPAHLVHPIAEGLDADRAGLIEPLANALHAWRLAGSPEGRRVAIIGCGPIGLSCLEVARYFGALSVTCVDLAEARRAAAEKLGADVVSDKLGGEFDVIFDAVGVAATRVQSIERLMPGGTTVWLGLATPDAGFDSLDLIRWEKNVRGMFAYNDDTFVEAIALAPHLALNWSTTFPLEQGAEVFTSLMRGATTPLKALLQP